MLELHVSTNVAPLAAAAEAITEFRRCSSELKYVMSPEDSGTSGHQFDPFTVATVADRHKRVGGREAAILRRVGAAEAAPTGAGSC
jgi:hypothetical protein